MAYWVEKVLFSQVVWWVFGLRFYLFGWSTVSVADLRRLAFSAIAAPDGSMDAGFFSVVVSNVD